MKKILAIETSCDDTAAAVFDGNLELSSVVHSQIEQHNQFGGVVPEIASRNHTMALPSVVERALQQANLSFSQIDYIACTFGAGLQGALLAGLSYAKALAYSLKIPFLPINHIQSHIAVNFLDTKPPFLCLVVSGGHTSVVKVLDYLTFEILDSTVDDSIGECFDKVARALGLGYPGGPIVERYSKKGEPKINFFKKANAANMGLSFSGLKTATINYIRQLDEQQLKLQTCDICASFSKIAIDIVSSAATKLVEMHNLDTIALAGGVAANLELQSALRHAVKCKNIKVKVPQFKYCTDNAAMVAICAYYQYVSLGTKIDLEQYLTVNANSGLTISQGF